MLFVQIYIVLSSVFDLSIQIYSVLSSVLDLKYGNIVITVEYLTKEPINFTEHNSRHIYSIDRHLL